MVRNGRVTDRTQTESTVDAQHEMETGGQEDDDIRVESPGARKARHESSTQDEDSDGDERAEIHYGHIDFDEHKRMVAFSNEPIRFVWSIL